MEYPIPTHLRDIFKVDEQHSDQTELRGKIVCPCGCEIFKIMHNEDREWDDSLPYGEQVGLKINTICVKCNQTLLLFDQATQGYDGFVCYDFKTASDDSLSSLTCEKCGVSMFHVKLVIEVEDKEQFMEECVADAPDAFKPEDYVDAFNWITVTVRCAACDYENDWIDLELS